MDGKLDVLVPCRTSVPSHSQVGVEGCPTSTVLWVGQGGKESRSPQPPTSKPRPKSKGVSLQRKSVKEEVQSEVQVEEVEGACRSLRDSGPPQVHAGPLRPLWTGKIVLAVDGDGPSVPVPPLRTWTPSCFTDPNWTSRTVLNLYLRLRVGLGLGRGFVLVDSFLFHGPELDVRVRSNGRSTVGGLVRVPVLWDLSEDLPPSGPPVRKSRGFAVSPQVHKSESPRVVLVGPRVRKSESCPLWTGGPGRTLNLYLKFRVRSAGRTAGPEGTSGSGLNLYLRVRVAGP